MKYSVMSKTREGWTLNNNQWSTVWKTFTVSIHDDISSAITHMNDFALFHVNRDTGEPWIVAIPDNMEEK